MSSKVKDRRITRPAHIRQLLQEQVNILRRDDSIESIDKARAIGYLSNIMLTSIKEGDFDDRLAEIEKQMNINK